MPQTSFRSLRHRSTVRLVIQPLAIAVGLALLVRSFAHLYVIPSASMAPTLAVGDHILVTPYMPGSSPQRGDIVVFRSPLRADELMVKRVVALPGDLVESRAGRLVIGAHTIAEPYVRNSTASGMISPQIVPARTCFVLGDNRENSADSRSWGVLPLDLIVGRARFVLWSSSRGSHSDSAWAATQSGGTAAGSREQIRFFRPIR